MDEQRKTIGGGYGPQAVANVPAFVALLGKKIDVTVLVHAGPGLQRLQALVGQVPRASDRLLTIGGVLGSKSADIEDVFAVEDFLTFYNAAFEAGLTEAGLLPGARVIDRISRTATADFKDHGLPADWLLRKRATALDALSVETLDRFETLFPAINTAMPQGIAAGFVDGQGEWRLGG